MLFTMLGYGWFALPNASWKPRSYTLLFGRSGERSSAISSPKFMSRKIVIVEEQERRGVGEVGAEDRRGEE